MQEHLGSSGSTPAVLTGPDDLPVSTLMAAETGAVLMPRPEEYVSMGADASVKVFLKSELRQNIFRIPPHYVAAAAMPDMGAVRNVELLAD